MKENYQIINGKFYKTEEISNQEILEILNGKEDKLQLEEHNLQPLDKKNLGEGCWEKDGEYYFTWDRAMEECKKQGKRMPTLQEWKEISKNLGENHGMKLSGYRYTNGLFRLHGSSYSNYWSSTEYNCIKARFQYFYSIGDNYYYDSKGNGFSVRCLKN